MRYCCVSRGRFTLGTHFAKTHGAKSPSTAMLLSAYHRRGDRAARDRVIVENMPLVHALARRFSRGPEQVDDLVQAGAIGLIKAVDGFEETRGADLGAYAVPTIVGELRRSVDDRAWPVRVPRDAADRGRVAVALDADALEAPEAEAELSRSEERALLRAGFQALSSRERRVVVLRYYRDWSQQRIAEELGLSQAHVSRVLAAALQKMRRVLVQQPAAREALCGSSRGTTISGR
jgi:RNA polymerase sigma-B factor